MKSHLLPSAVTCPACGTRLDGAFNTTSDDRPEEGDPSICIRCRALLVYCGSPVNSLRYPTVDEQRKFLADRAVQRGIAAVAAIHRDNGASR